MNSFPVHLKEKQLLKFETHIKDFNIAESTSLNAFKNLIENSEQYFLECSCKIINGVISGSRFALLFKDHEHAYNIKKSFDFLNSLKDNGAKLNYELLDKVSFEDLDLSKVKALGLGIDLRDDEAASRAKFWVAIENSNYRFFNSALDVFGYTDNMANLFNKNELLIGFDFYFNGKTKMKVYPHFYEYELKNAVISKRLEATFSPLIMEMINQCYMLYVSFEGAENYRLLHFNPHNLKKLCELINNDDLNKLIERISYKYSNCIVTLIENEILENNIKTINVYY
jgi:LynF/TruF/PatF family peptide O-prenyltransferase